MNGCANCRKDGSIWNTCLVTANEKCYLYQRQSCPIMQELVQSCHCRKIWWKWIVCDDWSLLEKHIANSVLSVMAQIRKKLLLKEGALKERKGWWRKCSLQYIAALKEHVQQLEWGWLLCRTCESNAQTGKAWCCSAITPPSQALECGIDSGSSFACDIVIRKRECLGEFGRLPVSIQRLCDDILICPLLYATTLWSCSPLYAIILWSCSLPAILNNPMNGPPKEYLKSGNLPAVESCSSKHVDIEDVVWPVQDSCCKDSKASQTFLLWGSLYLWWMKDTPHASAVAVISSQMKSWGIDALHQTIFATMSINGLSINFHPLWAPPENLWWFKPTAMCVLIKLSSWLTYQIDNEKCLQECRMQFALHLLVSDRSVESENSWFF